jgi:hypothetical protein
VARELTCSWTTQFNSLIIHFQQKEFIMKATVFTFAAFVALLLVGCANGSNPVQPAGVSVSSAGGATTASAAISGGNSGETRIEGTVTAVDAAAGTITIRSRVVQTNSQTKIERNGVRVRLSAIQVGDRGQARIPAGSTVASKVESVG